MRKQSIPGHFSPPTWPGNEAIVLLVYEPLSIQFRNTLYVGQFRVIGWSVCVCVCVSLASETQPMLVRIAFSI